MSEEKVIRAKEVIVDGINEAVEKAVVELKHLGISDDEALGALDTSAPSLGARFEAALRAKIKDLG